MTIELRRARIEDIEAIERVGLEADARFVEVGHPEIADGETIPRAASERAIANGRLIVATIDGALAGWVLTGRIEGELCVGHICVAPAFGQRGVGTALMGLVIDEARAANEPSIVLNTQRDVPWNAPWYERLGFVALDPDAWSSALRRLTERQSASGLDWATRVHMRLDLLRG